MIGTSRLLPAREAAPLAPCAASAEPAVLEVPPTLGELSARLGEAYTLAAAILGPFPSEPRHVRLLNLLADLDADLEGLALEGGRG